MPYIKSDNNRREALKNGDVAQNAGELNYKIFLHHKVCLKNNIVPSVAQVTFMVMGFLGQKPNYQKWNDMTGCLVRCDKEIKRRLNINFTFLLDIMESFDPQIADYEDEKIKENGDV